MGYNPTAYVQWLRETEPNAFGLEGMGGELEKLQNKKTNVHSLLEKERKAEILRVHQLLFGKNQE